MTSKVIYLGDLRTSAIHLKSGNSLITDAPTDNQGKGEAFSPTDLVATALANCMLTIMGIKARDNGWDINGTETEVEKIMVSGPRRIGTVKVKIRFPHNYEGAIKQILEKSARSCPVALSLHPDIQQEIIFEYPVDND